MRFLARVLPSVLALAAVAAVVLLLIGVFGQPPAGTAVTAGPQPTGSTPPAGTAPPPVSTPPPPTSTPTASAVTETPVATTTTPSGGTESPAPADPSAPSELPAIDVTVLNSTTEPGLAGRVSDYLASLGWSTVEPGNFTTALPATTVYFPDGFEEVARAVAAVAPGSGSTVAPVTPEVGADVVTVVLGEDAVGWSPPSPAPGT